MTAYDDLLDLVKEQGVLGSVQGLLSWDQEVMMPAGQGQRRAEQRSAVAGLVHDLARRDEIGELLEEIELEELTQEEQAQVREIRWSYDRATSVSKELVRETERATSEAQEVWKEARADDDFERFAPHLERVTELKREYADQIDSDRDPYAVLFDDYERDISLETVERILSSIKKGISSLITTTEYEESILEFEPDRVQRDVVRDIVESLGYDFDKGRLDTATHPFTAAGGRITTRYENWLEAITAAVHEAGHGMYEHGLPEEHFGTPLGDARSLTVHESQSRLFENHIGRSRAFWQQWLPRIQDEYGLEVDLEDLLRVVQRVEPGPIRVTADEVTYTIHIIVRFELERALVRDEIAVEELPAVWNEKMQEYLGVEPESDAEGVLQDVHWSMGNIGYFPTYTLGSVLAAQLFAAARDDIDDLQSRLRAGEYEPLRAWLHEHLWRHGKRYRTDELIEHATGKPLSADDYLDHLERRYSE